MATPAPTPSQHRAHAEAQRRITLEIRAVTISLRAALGEIEDDQTLSAAERIARRRAWCDEVAIRLQDIRARSMRMANILAGDPAAGGEPMEMLDAAEADLRRLADVA